MIDNVFLLCSPIEVVRTLIASVPTWEFWSAILLTFSRILIGFLVAFILGIVLGALSWRYSLFDAFFTPAVYVMKSVPVVCFIVLLLFWFGAPFVSSIVVFLAVFPAIYSSILEGLHNRDEKTAEMLRVHNVSFFRTLLTLNWQSVLPYLIASCQVSVGTSWKSGVAAEFIATTLGTIGEQMYQSKILLSPADLFAWTIVIVVAALLCEKGFLRLLRASGNWLWKAALPKPALQKGTHGKAGARRGAHSEAGMRARGEGAMRTARHRGQAESITVNRLVKTFGDNRVIDGFSAIFKPGQRYVLSDPSGAGKTSLLSLIAGLLPPDSGNVVYKGQFSMVFQEARLFEERSAIENVQLVAGSYLSTNEIRDLLSELLPPESLDIPVSQLSGGMRRRLELCRALAMPSQTLLLDEPFAGLDDASRELAYTLILNKLDNRILVIASHDQEDAYALDAQTVDFAT
ncbi:MAG: ATP-binding cassette domain-containing protein [Coriobacteriia bacterium]|nr:ATP-binding cassette domain-containing protein [Coriobacteriia bacterium]